MKKAFLISTLVGTLIGCASSPDKMQTTYISPIQYQSYDCDQISVELDRVSRRTNELYGTLKKEAGKDTAQMAIGLLLFWPTLFFLEGGDGPQAAEYSRLKGEYEALQTIATQKKCGIDMRPLTPQETQPEPIRMNSGEDF